MSTPVDMDRFFQCFEESLGVSRAELTLDKRILADLGADSLDLLDLIFNLEQAFSIEIPRGEFERRAKEALGDTPFEVNGLVTPEGLEQLKLHMPEAAADILPGLHVKRIPELFRVQSFHTLVAGRLAADAV